MTKRVLYEYQNEGIKTILNGLENGSYMDFENNVKIAHSFLFHDEMGLGKTIQALEVLKQIPDRDSLPCLIIAPSSCIQIWEKELKDNFEFDFEDVRIFPSIFIKVNQKTIFITSYETYRNQFKYYIQNNLDCGNLSEAELQRFCQINNKSIASVMALFGEEERKKELLRICRTVKMKSLKEKVNSYNQFMKQKWSFLILDEVHKIKNEHSSTAHAIGFIQAKYRLAISGTPVMNTAKDLMCILKFGLGLYNLNWNEIYNHPDGIYCENILNTLCMGRLKEDIQELKDVLPKRAKIDEMVILPWSDYEQRINYYHVKHSILADQAIIRNQTNFLSKVQKLRQICIHKHLPYYMQDTNYKPCANNGWNMATHSTFTPWMRKRIFVFLCCIRRFNLDLRLTLIKYFVKIDTQLIEPSVKMVQVYELLKQHDKIVVFCSFKVFLEHIMQPWLDQIGVESVIHCGNGRKKQKQAIKTFHDDPLTRVLLIVKQSGAEGLNLQVASNVCVIMDPHFNTALDEQAAQRIDRLGQKKEVIIRKLCMEGSIDEAMKMMQKNKLETTEAWLKKHSNEKKRNLESHSMFLSKYDTVTM